MNDPFLGPADRDDTHPLTDDAEVREALRLLYDRPLSRMLHALMGLPFEERPFEEVFDSAAELGAARDLEEWGCNPFEED